MKTISVQIQTNRAPKLNKRKVVTLLFELFNKTSNASELKIEKNSGQKYINVNFKSKDIKSLWNEIQCKIFHKKGIGSALQSCTIVVCEGKRSWKDYRLLHHFDKKLI